MNCFSTRKDKKITLSQEGEVETVSSKTPYQALLPLESEPERQTLKESSLENQWGWCPRGPKYCTILNEIPLLKGSFMSDFPQDPVKKQQFEKHLDYIWKNFIC